MKITPIPHFYNMPSDLTMEQAEQFLAHHKAEHCEISKIVNSLDITKLYVVKCVNPNAGDLDKKIRYLMKSGSFTLTLTDAMKFSGDVETLEVVVDPKLLVGAEVITLNIACGGEYIYHMTAINKLELMINEMNKHRPEPIQH